jgi:WD40 repeat protein
VAFGADSRFLYSFATDGTVRQWPLSADVGPEPRIIHDWGHPVDAVLGWMAPSPNGRFVVTTGAEDTARLVPLDGSVPVVLGGYEQRVLRAAVSPDGRFVAVPGRLGGKRMLRIWEPESGSVSDFDLGDPGPDTLAWVVVPEFLADGRLLVAINGPLFLLDPVSGDREQVADGVGRFVVAREAPIVLSRRTVDSAPSTAWVHDLDAGTSGELTGHGRGVSSLALDATGTVAVTGGSDGIIRVGPMSGGKPHLLVGPSGRVVTVDVSPDGRWIASGHADGTIRLWPMPDLERPPIHDLPHEQLTARLRSLTNLRVVQDPDDPGDHTVVVEELPDWHTVPDW